MQIEQQKLRALILEILLREETILTSEDAPALTGVLMNGIESFVEKDSAALPDMSVCHSEFDDVPIVFVDTEQCSENMEGPLLRIYLNDEAVYENPSLPEENPNDRE